MRLTKKNWVIHPPIRPPVRGQRHLKLRHRLGLRQHRLRLRQQRKRLSHNQREQLKNKSAANAAAGQAGTSSDETKVASMRYADQSVMRLNKHKISNGFLQLGLAFIKR